MVFQKNINNYCCGNKLNLNANATPHKTGKQNKSKTYLNYVNITKKSNTMPNTILNSVL